MLAKHALSQLSYGPLDGNRRDSAARATARRALLRVSLSPRTRTPAIEANKMVGLGGLEPPTSRLSSARSNQLSYKPEPVRALIRARKALWARPGRKRNEDGGMSR